MPTKRSAGKPESATITESSQKADIVAQPEAKIQAAIKQASKPTESKTDVSQSSPASQHSATTNSIAKPTPQTSPQASTSKNKTRITIKYDVGFGNSVTIRGEGANLNWHKGTPLVNSKRDEWVFETDASFNKCEFKVLLNDRIYEQGSNHQLHQGATIQYTPRF